MGKPYAGKPLEFKHQDIYINYKGPIHFQEWYKLVYAFLIEKGYTSAEQPGDPNFEDLVSENTTGSGTKHYWVWWRTRKKRDDMFTYQIDIDFQSLNMKYVEIMHNGKKIKANNGEANMFMRAKVIVDPENTWGKNWLTREIYDLLRRKHFEAQIDAERAFLYDEYLELYDRAKQALGCLTIEHREIYHIGEKAYPDV